MDIRESVCWSVRCLEIGNSRRGFWVACMYLKQNSVQNFEVGVLQIHVPCCGSGLYVQNVHCQKIVSICNTG
jgi:hypothetical protein